MMTYKLTAEIGETFFEVTDVTSEKLPLALATLRNNLDVHHISIEVCKRGEWSFFRRETLDRSMLQVSKEALFSLCEGLTVIGYGLPDGREYCNVHVCQNVTEDWLDEALQNEAVDTYFDTPENVSFKCCVCKRNLVERARMCH